METIEIGTRTYRVERTGLTEIVATLHHLRDDRQHGVVFRLNPSRALAIAANGRKPYTSEQEREALAKLEF